MEALKRLLGIHTDVAELIRVSREAYRKGHPELAELVLTRAAALSPKDAGLHVALAENSYALGRDDDALESYESAMRLDPARPEPLLGIAASLHRMGRASEAVYYYLAYLEKRPDDVGALLSAASVFQATAQYDAAVEMFERAAQLDPANPQVRGQEGQALYEMGRNDEAIVELSRAVKLGSRDARVFRGLGLALYAQARPAEARESFERAIDLDPNDPTTHIELAQILNDSQPTAEEARASAEHARRATELLRSQKGPRDELASALWELGWSYYLVGDWKRSVDASRESLANDPGNAPVRFNLGLALLRAGKREEALAEYRRASEAVEDLWALSIHGIDDLEATKSTVPDLPGREEVLAFLSKRFDELKNQRASTAAP
ncbi:MAG: tetratricopeptide repeat protein [Solirubrobacterales bacterium]|nr:tetratricopeptide repeat protein [Solirubrobacterales bacterium]